MLTLIMFRIVLLLLTVSSCSSFSTTKLSVMASDRILSTTHQFNGATAVGSSFRPLYRKSQLNGAEVSAVETFFITKPYLAAFLTCSVKASAADLIAQTKASTANVDVDLRRNGETKAETPEANLDVSRNAAFLLYGGLYQGMVQQFMYSNVFPSMFGHDLDLYGLASQVAFDMMIVGPFLCLPLAYAVKGVFSSSNGAGTSEALQQGLEKYVNDVTSRGLLLKYWALWTPVNFLTFGVVPSHFRVAFVAFISFFWIFILSSTAAVAESHDESDVSTHQTA